MPIQFRCGHCNQLLGISRRKAGAVVDCPTCGGKIVVPRIEESEPVAEAPALLEMPNFSAILKPPALGHAVASAGPEEVLSLAPRAGDRPLSAGPAERPANVPAPEVPPRPAGEANAAPADGAHMGTSLSSMLLRPPGPGIWLSPAKATLLSVLAVLLLTVAFLVGFFLGRSLG